MKSIIKKIDWIELIIGILFFILSLAAFNDPTGSLVSITIYIGIITIIKGLFYLFFYYKLKKIAKKNTVSFIFVGVLDIILGAVLLSNISYGVIALPFIFSIWFLTDSIGNLFSLDMAREISSGYFWFSLIINIIGIMLGISLLYNPIISALTLSFIVGSYLMIVSFSLVAHAFNANNS